MNRKKFITAFLSNMEVSEIFFKKVTGCPSMDAAAVPQNAALMTKGWFELSPSWRRILCVQWAALCMVVLLPEPAPPWTMMYRGSGYLL